MSAGLAESFGRFVLAQGDDPVALLRTLRSFWRILDAAEAVSAERVAARAPLVDLIAIRGVCSDVREGIAACNAALARIARRGGRGVPVTGCRGGAPAVMGHGWPALAQAVGPAHAELPDPRHNIHANLLFAARTVQELPGARACDNLRNNGGDNR